MNLLAIRFQIARWLLTVSIGVGLFCFVAIPLLAYSSLYGRQVNWQVFGFMWLGRMLAVLLSGVSYLLRHSRVAEIIFLVEFAWLLSMFTPVRL